MMVAEMDEGRRYKALYPLLMMNGRRYLEAEAASIEAFAVVVRTVQ